MKDGTISEGSISYMGAMHGMKAYWMVTGEFTDQFAFLGAEDNHDVASMVERAGLMTENCTLDPESSQFYAYFPDGKAGEAEAKRFVAGLNGFLRAKHEAVAKALEIVAEAKRI